MTVEPRTEAGKRLLDWFGGPMKPGEARNLQSSIAEIESEARAAALREVAEAVRALPMSQYPMVKGAAVQALIDRDQVLRLLTETTGASE